MARKNWFNIEAKAAGTTIHIFDEIGVFGVTAASFIRELNAANGAITVEINSPGGSVFDALAIYNAMLSKDVTVKIMGVAASAASIIAMAGKTVTAPANAFMMIHNPLIGTVGNADELRTVADTLDKVRDSLVSIYQTRSKVQRDELIKMLDAETWLTATEAQAIGLIDIVEDSMELAASYDVAQLPEQVAVTFNAVSEASEGQVEVTTPAVVIVEPVESSEPFTATIVDIANNEDLSEFATMWALDSSIQTMADIKQKVSEAKEIKFLCELSGNGQMTAKFIKSRKGVSAVRDELCELLADSDESTHTSSYQKPEALSEPTKVEVKTSSIWEARYKSK